MKQKPVIACKLIIDKIQVKPWTLKKGERFCLSFNGYNNLKERFEIYLKISHAKCILDSVPTKDEYLIPNLIAKNGGYVFKLTEYWIIED